MEFNEITEMIVRDRWFLMHGSASANALEVEDIRRAVEEAGEDATMSEIIAILKRKLV